MVWAKRIGVVVVIVAALAVAGYFIFKQQIAEAMFERAVTQNVGRDRTVDLEDGLHVYMCGTGSPIADPSRAGPCMGVLAGDRAFIFDVGSGGMRNLARMGFPVGRTERLYLTHMHSDHFDGLGELLVQAWMGGNRSEPLPISGPPGVIETIEGFNAAYRIDSTYRIAHHGTQAAIPTGYGGAPSEIILPEGASSAVVLREGDLTITAFAVSHNPIENPMGFRIDYKDRSISISGDTIYDERLVEASQGVDVLFHEALDTEMVAAMERAAAARGNDQIAKIFSDIPDYHASPEDAARAAHDAGAGQLVFYHIVPPMPVSMLQSLYLRGVSDEFSDPVRLGEDGLLVSLPAGSDSVEYNNVIQ